MRITVVPPADAPRRANPGQVIIDTTSHNKSQGHLFSPFHLGPVPLYDGTVALNMENAWQYAKVYASLLESDGTVGATYFNWAREGWDNPQAVRYPVRKGAKPLFSLWAGEQLSYVEARKALYLPLYRDAVKKSGGYDVLKDLATSHEELVLVDFDAYPHKTAKMSYADVLNNGTRPMGHAFVLAMMLELGPNVDAAAVESACNYRAASAQGSMF